MLRLFDYAPEWYPSALSIFSNLGRSMIQVKWIFEMVFCKLCSRICRYGKMEIGFGMPRFLRIFWYITLPILSLFFPPNTAENKYSHGQLCQIGDSCWQANARFGIPWFFPIFLIWGCLCKTMGAHVSHHVTQPKHAPVQPANCCWV